MACRIETVVERIRQVRERLDRISAELGAPPMLAKPTKPQSVSVVKVKTYGDAKAFERDAARMARKGYEIATQSAGPPKRVTIYGAMLGRKTTGNVLTGLQTPGRIVVTYRKAQG